MRFQTLALALFGSALSVNAAVSSAKPALPAEFTSNEGAEFDSIEGLTQPGAGSLQARAVCTDPAWPRLCADGQLCCSDAYPRCCPTFCCTDAYPYCGTDGRCYAT